VVPYPTKPPGRRRPQLLHGTKPGCRPPPAPYSSRAPSLAAPAPNSSKAPSRGRTMNQPAASWCIFPASRS
jgi:hypothetical protein